MGGLSSRRAAAHQTGEQADVPDVVDVLLLLVVAQPHEEPLEAEAESTVRARAVLPLVREPVVRSRVKLLTLVRRHQLVVVVDPHRSSDDLTDARHQQVHGLGQVRLSRHLLHVERLQRGREARHEHRLADERHELTLRAVGDVLLVAEVPRVVLVALLRGVDLVLAAHGDRLRVRHALERPLRDVALLPAVRAVVGPVLHRAGVELPDLVAARRHEALEHADHNVLQTLEQVLEVDEGVLGLNVRELGQVALRLRLLRAVRRQDAEAVADHRDGGLEVQLARLRHVRRLAVEVQVEEAGPALALRLHHRRRLHLEAVLVEEVVAERLHGEGAHAHHRRRGRRAEHQVALLELLVHVALVVQHVVQLRVAHAVDRPLRHGHLERRAALVLRSLRLRLDLALQGKARLPGQLRQVLVLDHDLHHAGAVADHQERCALLLADGVRPPAHDVLLLQVLQLRHVLQQRRLVAAATVEEGLLLGSLAVDGEGLLLHLLLRRRLLLLHRLRGLVVRRRARAEQGRHLRVELRLQRLAVGPLEGVGLAELAQHAAGVELVALRADVGVLLLDRGLHGGCDRVGGDDDAGAARGLEGGGVEGLVLQVDEELHGGVVLLAVQLAVLDVLAEEGAVLLGAAGGDGVQHGADGLGALRDVKGRQQADDHLGEVLVLQHVGGVLLIESQHRNTGRRVGRHDSSQRGSDNEVQIL
eukprot:Rhum_TRINITY_DN23058_c0_g1::Rhum_TRINITY_DN23058_c0_g1_i1::g.177050::m.177050